MTLTTGGTATRGVDYTIAPTVFTIDEGQTTGTAAVTIVDDEESDDSETIHIFATSTNPVLTGAAAGYGLGLTIADNDGGGSGTSDDGAGAPAPSLPTLPALSIADAVAAEGETARFRVTLDRASQRTVTVDYRTHQGTAAAASDFAGKSGTLKFAPGAMERFIEVQTLDDTDDEDSEKFTVELSNPAGATLLDNIGIGTISDDDDPPPPLPALSIADAVAAEGETVRFRVTLSAASGQAVTVDYRTRQGTAITGGDFTGESGTLSFAPNATERFIEVQTLDDTDDEDSEKFTVELSNPAGATLLGDIGIGTIVDDDDPPPPPLPALSIADAVAVEGETVRFRVTLDMASQRAVTVDYGTRQGTAAAGVDFTGKVGHAEVRPEGDGTVHRGGDARRHRRRGLREIHRGAEQPRRRDAARRHRHRDDRGRRRSAGTAAAGPLHRGRGSGGRRDCALQGDAERGEPAGRDGGLPDAPGHGGRRRRLHRGVGHAELRAEHDGAVHRGGDARGRCRRARRNVLGGVEQLRRRNAARRHRHRNDRGRRRPAAPAAAGPLHRGRGGGGRRDRALQGNAGQGEPAGRDGGTTGRARARRPRAATSPEYRARWALRRT